MNGVRGKFMKKLKSMKPPIAYLKQDRVLQVIAPNGYSDFLTRNQNLEANLQKSNHKNDINLLKENRDFAIEDEETEESGFAVEDKENIEPSGKSNGGIGDSMCLRAGNCLPESKRETPLSEIDISSFRRPDMNSGSLFDPNLLEVFHHAPKLFIRGRYIGGAEEVLGLHEQGKLRPLFDGVPIDCFAGIPCEGCGGVRFVLCFNSHFKIIMPIERILSEYRIVRSIFLNVMTTIRLTGSRSKTTNHLVPAGSYNNSLRNRE